MNHYIRDSAIFKESAGMEEFSYIVDSTTPVLYVIAHKRMDWDVNLFRISISGIDDICWVFDTYNENEYTCKFLELIGSDMITFDKLKELGFKSGL